MSFKNVGDDFTADVQGSISSGINGIWLNRNRQELYSGMTIIQSFKELKDKLDYTTSEW